MFWILYRFLNYMSSIMQNRNLKTMYITAKELGIESFLVDLRHLCAHGQVMPSLDIFRRTANYCFHWLEGYYWKREIEAIQDATIRDVRLEKFVRFERNIKELFTVYDAATEVMHKKCKLTTDIDQTMLDEEYRDSLNAYSMKIRNNKLSAVVTLVINELTEIASKENRVRGNAQLYCDVLFQCKYFIDTAAKYTGASSGTTIQQKEFISLHQNLFRSMAICGFIETCFKTLMDICEDEHELTKRRRGASFWANEITIGFIAFKDLKNMFKAKKDKNNKFQLDLTPVNTDSMTKDIRQMYKSLGVNCNGILIFGDTIRRPWSLTFNRNYITDRITNVNEHTKNVVKKYVNCLKVRVNIFLFFLM